MLRNLLIASVLAALAALTAAASPNTPATARRHESTASTSHAAAHSKAHHRAEAPAHTPHSAAVSRHSRATGHRHSAALSRSKSLALAPTPASLRRGRTVALGSSALKGSLESLERQNEQADAEGLERILDEDDLNDRIAQKLLVPVPVASGLTIDEKLPESHRYCRPWTADFLGDLTTAHATRFGHPLFISSAVRTVEYQRQLMGINGNAAAAEGDIVSPHLTGGTIDIAKTGMNRKELAWMRNWLLPVQKSGMIDVEEEFRQACFHITVYKNYTTPPPFEIPDTPSAPSHKSRRHHTAPYVQIASRSR